MQFTLTVNLDNAAFDDPRQLGDILQRIADKLADAVPAAGSRGNVRDVNGNTVGAWTVEP